MLAREPGVLTVRGSEVPERVQWRCGDGGGVLSTQPTLPRLRSCSVVGRRAWLLSSRRGESVVVA